MTRLNAKDLPPALRRQVERKVNDYLIPDETKAKMTRYSVTRGTNRWTCAACHEAFTAWSRAERHSDEYQHHRIELDVTREER